MLSGTGRHRRPRQAPAILVTAGVTSAGIAMPFMGATGAQAVEPSTWDAVAQCESGGTWSANQDNGYYGGFQLTLKTWKKYGGTEYAARPDLASRGQQIAVAEKILAGEGPEAWPVCAVSSGLAAEANASADGAT
ncbi:transglycosylase family protein, partial [Streptomyces durbertensis]